MRPNAYDRMIAATLLMAGIWIVGLCGRDSGDGSKPFDYLEENGLFIGTSGESEARSRTVLPNGPSEDAGHVLGDPPSEVARSEPDGGPDDGAEWIVEVELAARKSRAEIIRAFDRASWPEEVDVGIYAFCTATQRWTYLTPGDGSETSARLRVSAPYRSLEGQSLSADDASTVLTLVRERAARLGVAIVSVASSPDECEARARRLDALAPFVEHDLVAITLLAPPGQTFEGVALWDALASLGLEWGDMDLFHWPNGVDAPGDDAVFSVATSTAPGYFFPEEAVRGRLHVRDLVFELSIVRTHRPLEAFDRMMRAARYVQGRLGGDIVGDEAAQRLQIRAIEQSMQRAGVAPGSPAALQLF